MNALSKANIAEWIAQQVGLQKNESRHLVDQFFEVIRLSLEQGQDVKLSGFGNFILRDKSERPGRNPKTGEEIPVDARRVVTFKSGLKLKSKIGLKQKRRHAE